MSGGARVRRGERERNRGGFRGGREGNTPRQGRLGWRPGPRKRRCLRRRGRSQERLQGGLQGEEVARSRGEGRVGSLSTGETPGGGEPRTLGRERAAPALQGGLNAASAAVWRCSRDEAEDGEKERSPSAEPVMRPWATSFCSMSSAGSTTLHVDQSVQLRPRPAIPVDRCDVGTSTWCNSH